MSAALPPLARVLAGSLERAGSLIAAESARRGSSPARPTPRPGGRRAAVLVLFGPGTDGGGDVVLLERASDMRAHPGQVAFPGGGLDAADGGDPVVAALREAREEVGLDAGGVSVLGQLPAIEVPPGGTSVTPVVAWRSGGPPLVAGDPVEVAAVLRVQLADLADPAHRHVARTSRGWTGPAFSVGGVLVWGFTAIVLAALLRAADLEEPWDAGVVIDVPARFAGRVGGAA